MSGKPKDDPTKTQQEEIAAKKLQCIEVYATLGVKKAAAAAVGRTLKHINEWEAEDEQFRLEMSRAEYRFLDKHKHKVKLDNVFAHLFEEYAPPIQKVDAKVTTIEGQSAEDLLAEAKRLGLDTTPYKPLLIRTRAPGTATEDPDQEGA